MLICVHWRITNSNHFLRMKLFFCLLYKQKMLLYDKFFMQIKTTVAILLSNRYVCIVYQIDQEFVIHLYDLGMSYSYRIQKSGVILFFLNASLEISDWRLKVGIESASFFLPPTYKNTCTYMEKPPTLYQIKKRTKLYSNVVFGQFIQHNLVVMCAFYMQTFYNRKINI